jgi:hypothetical protein
MGELQGGWLTSNAVLGYSIHDLNSGKNILGDLYEVQR